MTSNDTSVRTCDLLAVLRSRYVLVGAGAGGKLRLHLRLKQNINGNLKTNISKYLNFFQVVKKEYVV